MLGTCPVNTGACVDQSITGLLHTTDSSKECLYTAGPGLTCEIRTNPVKNPQKKMRVGGSDAVSMSTHFTHSAYESPNINTDT